MEIEDLPISQYVSECQTLPVSWEGQGCDEALSRLWVGRRRKLLAERRWGNGASSDRGESSRHVIALVRMLGTLSGDETSLVGPGK